MFAKCQKKQQQMIRQQLEKNTVTKSQLTCAICLGIYDNPVVCSSGRSYCAKCIKKSVEMGNTRCPITNIEIQQVFYPNIELKQIVEQYKSKYQIKNTDNLRELLNNSFEFLEYFLEQFNQIMHVTLDINGFVSLLFLDLLEI
ncbi:Conserved_hypothetical protein [Hexamita inflata]|uniref:RING-type domain-containing protein n=1 Tax=Hexamita inflata TaxID=28002 RepID=A0AA86PPY3_9EUKA|nr:Conserved hypothetical protein [Hexamita inflata]